MRTKYCIVELTGGYSESSVARVSGPYTKKRAVAIIREFSRDGTKPLGNGNWVSLRCAPFFEVANVDLNLFRKFIDFLK